MKYQVHPRRSESTLIGKLILSKKHQHKRGNSSWNKKHHSKIIFEEKVIKYPQAALQRNPGVTYNIPCLAGRKKSKGFTKRISDLWRFLMLTHNLTYQDASLPSPRVPKTHNNSSSSSSSLYILTAAAVRSSKIKKIILFCFFIFYFLLEEQQLLEEL